MTASVSSHSVISRVTLALLEDTGWYIPDYAYGSQLDWGYMQGCHFTDNSCLGWIHYAVHHNISTIPFCIDPVEKECGDAKDECEMRKYSSNLHTDYKVRMYVHVLNFIVKLGYCIIRYPSNRNTHTIKVHNP